MNKVELGIWTKFPTLAVVLCCFLPRVDTDLCFHDLNFPQLLRDVASLVVTRKARCSFHAAEYCELSYSLWEATTHNTREDFEEEKRTRCPYKSQGNRYSLREG